MHDQPVIDEQQLDLLRRKLLDERRQIEVGRGEREKDTDTDERDQEALAQAMKERARRRLIQIDHALERMESEDFGCCEGCGDTISRARLAADPAVKLCIECAESSQH